MNDVIEQLKQVRESRKISQRELSKRCGVPQKTISRIESGVDIPKLSTLSKISEALDLSLRVELVPKIERQKGELYNG